MRKLPVFFLLGILLLLLGLSRLSADTGARQKQALEDALNRNISHCYILEGRYPESLQYIREHYGLHYDESRFFVDYQVSAANLWPLVTILERGAGA